MQKKKEEKTYYSALFNWPRGTQKKKKNYNNQKKKWVIHFNIFFPFRKLYGQS